jgi:hypothetical protein
MTTKILYGELLTDKTIEEVRQAVRSSFEIVGGEIQDTPSGVLILKGTNQVPMTFTTMNFHSTVDVAPVATGKYSLVCTIKWLPHWFHIIMLVGGFAAVIPWLYNILFFFVKPVSIYKQALDRVAFYIQ